MKIIKKMMNFFIIQKDKIINKKNNMKKKKITLTWIISNKCYKIQKKILKVWVNRIYFSILL